jgi:glycosyltransferase involved in cell wall biosynthesis
LNKLKVIFCTDGIFPHEIGGMQRHSRLLIEHLAKRNEVDIVVIHPHAQTVFAPELAIKEISIEPINKNKNYLFECYLYSKRIYDVLVKYPEHIIYSQGLSVWYNIKKVSSRVIINPHGLEPYQSLTFKEKLIGIPFKLIFNYLFKHARKVVSLGGSLTNILTSNIDQSRSKIVVLPNAVILSSDQQVKKQYLNSKLKLLFVARFAHNKGIHILLEAIKQLNDEGYQDKFEFDLGGKGPLFEHYSSNLKYKNVNYLGFVSDEQLIELYKTNDLFVFPTLFEGMPTVVLEAMSHGMPIVVSDVGATAELVNDRNGYLINKNSVRELKEAIINFYKLSVEEKEQLSAYALLQVKNKYTWNIVAQQHIELFQKIQ